MYIYIYIYRVIDAHSVLTAVLSIRVSSAVCIKRFVLYMKYLILDSYRSSKYELRQASVCMKRFVQYLKPVVKDDNDRFIVYINNKIDNESGVL